MAITFVNPNTATGTATNLVLTQPTGTAVNDLLIATVELFDGGTVIQSVAPAGWNVLKKVQNSAVGNAHSMATLWRLDNGSASYTLTWDNSSQFRVGQILAYRGASGVDVDSLTPQTATTTVFRGTTVTTTVANAMLVMIGGHGNVGTATPPSGMTERVDTNRQYSADVLQAAAGATGDKDATLAVADANIAGIIALRPIIRVAQRRVRTDPSFSSSRATYSG